MKHLTTQRIYHVQPSTFALALRGNKFNGAAVFAEPWSETTDMQARPGASRSATSRKFPITVFSSLEEHAPGVQTGLAPGQELM